MPTPKVISLSSKLHALSLVDVGKASIRSAALTVGLAKSTLHDNLPKFRKAQKDFEVWLSRSEERMVREALSIAIEGKSSARDTAVVLSRMEGRNVDHHKVLDILEKAGQIAAEQNSMRIPMHVVGDGKEVKQPPLSYVRCAAFDEIFQGKSPILSFIEPVSGYCYLSATTDRSGDSWAEMLAKLKVLGLNPKTTNTDGAQGLLKGLDAVFPNAINLRDLFHVVTKMGKAVRAFEGRCYGLIALVDSMTKHRDVPTKVDERRRQMERAIALFDALEAAYKRFKTACYCTSSHEYVNSGDLEAIIKRIIALIECVQRNGINHRAINEAKTYFQGATPAIVAYKAQLEIEVQSAFGEINGLSVLDSICPMIEFLDQVQRSYENTARKEFWAKKLVEARSDFRKFDFIDQDEVDRAINRVARIMSELKKSNSLVENLNSVIRRFLVTYKSIPSWFCSLFTFYWNHRTMKRGKRKGLKAREILTGQSFEHDWIDIIIENWASVPAAEKTESPELNTFKEAS